jgi:hydrogenase expression/formation protein HypC
MGQESEMCIAIPGRVLGLDGERAEIDVLGARRRAATSVCPDVRVGDYVLLNAGLIIEILDRDEALANLALLEELMALDLPEAAEAAREDAGP